MMPPDQQPRDDKKHEARNGKNDAVGGLNLRNSEGCDPTENSGKNRQKRKGKLQL